MLAQGVVASGLSPRVRGNLEFLNAFPTFLGSIPACAGEPGRGRRGKTRMAVYPRVCGGTSVLEGRANARRGLSPRVRGNRPVFHLIAEPHRSIPACAGEPRLRRLPALPSAVYPRVCGGTPRWCDPEHIVHGLSPRVRGNLPFVRLPCVADGSIPRVCGGTTGRGK